MVRRKKRIAAMAVCLCLCLGGCSLTGLDAQGLINPPKANADQQAIHALLKSDKEEINFVYPKNGDYRSAVIMHDFTGNGKDDALGFSAEPEGGVTLRFMIKGPEGWSTLASVKNPATQVDRVCFGDLTGDGQEEVVVGWGAPQSMTANICIYTYAGGRVKEYPLEHTYNELAITDLNEDKVDELFTATIFTKTEEEDGKDKNAIARIFTFSENKPELSLSCVLNDTVVRYSGITFSGIDSHKKGVVLEGVMADNSTITQILYLEEEGKKLAAPLSGTMLQQKYNYFNRPSSIAITSKDVDGDGIMEYPKLTVQPGYSMEGSLDSYCYYVDWVKFDTVQLTHKEVKRQIFNFSENYVLEIPQNIKEEIGCFSTEPRTLTFRQIQSDKGGVLLNSKKLFTIKAFSPEEWKKSPGDYSLLLLTRNNAIYGEKVFDYTKGTMELIKKFKLIQE
ncbi:MAG: VCBS repeat-containing protein [Oscillospiraceae bacterium]